jgi:tight adherence protein C
MNLELLLTFGAIFVSVGLITGTLASHVLANAAPGRKRLRTLANASEGTLLMRDPASLLPSLAPAAKRFAALLPKSPKDMSRLQKRMALAGYHGVTPVLVFLASEIVTPVVLGLGMLFFGPAGAARILMAVFSAMLGYLMPGLLLQRRIAKRKKVIQNGLPDALDLFIVCLEAGSSLDQAILKTSQDLDVPYPPLAEELRMITTEMRAGKPRLEAFKNFATRTGVDDVRALVSMLVQSDRFGTSIALALRTHADTSRTKRRQRAEERAGKIGVKLVFPLVFCLFPAFYVVTLGPGVIQFIRFFETGFVK